MIFLISASWVTRTTGMSHWGLPHFCRFLYSIWSNKNSDLRHLKMTVASH
jgi:hypothetical protein